MKLRVNLIDEREIRDCSIITVRFLVRFLAGIVVAVILTVLGWAFVTSQRNAAALKEETWKWSRIGDDFKRAQALAARRQAIERVAADLDGWQKARHSWRDELTALAFIIPESLQLTELRVTSEISVPPAAEPDAAPAKPPELSASLRLIGKTSSPTAEVDVARLRDVFSTPPFSNTVSSADIPQGAFRLDPSPNAGPTGRVFEVLCTYRVKTLK